MPLYSLHVVAQTKFLVGKVDTNPMSSRALILVAICFALSIGPGCGQSPSPSKPSPSPSPSPAVKPLSSEEQKAVDFAKAFLAKNAADWGNPSEVRLADVEYVPGWKGEGYYLVTYPTPADEIKLLGDRSVVVEIKSGRVECVPRD